MIQADSAGRYGGKHNSKLNSDSGTQSEITV